MLIRSLDLRKRKKIYLKSAFPVFRVARYLARGETNETLQYSPPADYYGALTSRLNRRGRRDDLPERVWRVTSLVLSFVSSGVATSGSDTLRTWMGTVKGISSGLRQSNQTFCCLPLMSSVKYLSSVSIIRYGMLKQLE